MTKAEVVLFEKLRIHRILKNIVRVESHVEKSDL